MNIDTLHNGTSQVQLFAVVNGLTYRIRRAYSDFEAHLESLEIHPDWPLVFTDPKGRYYMGEVVNDTPRLAPDPERIAYTDIPLFAQSGGEFFEVLTITDDVNHANSMLEKHRDYSVLVSGPAHSFNILAHVEPSA